MSALVIIFIAQHCMLGFITDCHYLVGLRECDSNLNLLYIEAFKLMVNIVALNAFVLVSDERYTGCPERKRNPHELIMYAL